tara:strand:- start:9925 stop:10176 length:252 start_codon:yes stop_codon:yes gene_type:complete
VTDFKDLVDDVLAGNPDVAPHDEQRAYYSEDGKELIVEMKWCFVDRKPLIEKQIRNAADPSNPGWGKRLADSLPGIWVKTDIN